MDDSHVRQMVAAHREAFRLVQKEKHEAMMPPPNRADRRKAKRRDASNARIAKFKAERDELQRRLDAILDRLPEGGVWCYACNRASKPIITKAPYEFIDPKYNQMRTVFRCPICKRKSYAKDSCVDTLRAIAEGRVELPTG